MLNDIHHESTLQRTEMFQHSEYIQHKFLIIFHVGRMYLQQIIETAGDVIALRHLRNDLYPLGKFLRNGAIHTPHLHITEHDKALIEFLSVKNCHILDRKSVV